MYVCLSANERQGAKNWEDRRRTTVKNDAEKRNEEKMGHEWNQASKRASQHPNCDGRQEVRRRRQAVSEKIDRRDWEEAARHHKQVQRWSSCSTVKEEVWSVRWWWRKRRSLHPSPDSHSNHRPNCNCNSKWEDRDLDTSLFLIHFQMHTHTFFPFRSL